jgi:hypothetical protein
MLAVGKARTPWPAGGAPSCPFSSSSCLYADGAQAEALLPLVRALLPPLRGGRRGAWEVGLPERLLGDSAWIWGWRGRGDRRSPVRTARLLGWVAVDARAPPSPRARRLEEAGELRGEESSSLERDERDEEEYHHARCIVDSSSARLSPDEPSTMWRQLHQLRPFRARARGQVAAHKRGGGHRPRGGERREREGQKMETWIPTCGPIVPRR